MDGRVGGWVGGEGGDLFSHDLVFWRGPASNPHSVLASPPDGLCLRRDWQFLPLLGILAFLSVIPLPPAVSSPLRTSNSADAPSLVGALSVACLSLDTAVSTPRRLSCHPPWQHFIWRCVAKSQNKVKHRELDVV